MKRDGQSSEHELRVVVSASDVARIGTTKNIIQLEVSILCLADVETALPLICSSVRLHVGGVCLSCAFIMLFMANT